MGVWECMCEQMSLRCHSCVSVSTVLGQARRPPKWSSLVELLPSFLAVTHHHTGHEEDY